MEKIAEKESMPLVSIIIPVYNGANFLSQAIDSALAQTYSNIEILVINDGSIDHGATHAVAEKYGNRVRYFEKKNGGVASALNLGIEKMKGKYFSWLSHDDLYTKDKVEKQVQALSLWAPNDRKKTIIYSDFSVFTTDHEDPIPMRIREVAPNEFRCWITMESGLHGCTLLIPKEAFTEVGTFNESLRTTQDYELWFRMAAQYQFVHIPELLVMARSHAEQGSLIMSTLAVTEGNALLSGFVTSLTLEELAYASDRSLAVAYARISLSIFYRGLWAAGWTASRLSFSHLESSNFFDFLIVFNSIFVGVLKYFFVGPIRQLMPAYVRASLKRRFSS